MEFSPNPECELVVQNEVARYSAYEFDAQHQPKPTGIVDEMELEVLEAQDKIIPPPRKAQSQTRTSYENVMSSLNNVVNEEPQPEPFTESYSIPPVPVPAIGDDSVQLKSRHHDQQSDSEVNIASTLSGRSKLRPLKRINGVFIQKKKSKFCQGILTCQSKIEYIIKNLDGQNILNASIEKPFCSKFICGPYRSFEMKIIDSDGQEIIHLSKKFEKLVNYLCPFSSQKIEIYSPPGKLLGVVEQEGLKAKFTVKNASQEIIFKIDCYTKCPFSIFSDVKFQILDENGQTEIGLISKKWNGIFQNDTLDNFGIKFPAELDAHKKACLIGACFLIDSLYFE